MKERWVYELRGFTVSISPKSRVSLLKGGSVMARYQAKDHSEASDWAKAWINDYHQRAGEDA